MAFKRLYKLKALTINKLFIVAEEICSLWIIHGTCFQPPFRGFDHFSTCWFLIPNLALSHPKSFIKGIHLSQCPSEMFRGPCEMLYKQMLTPPSLAKLLDLFLDLILSPFYRGGNQNLERQIGWYVTAQDSQFLFSRPWPKVPSSVTHFSWRNVLCLKHPH